MGFANRLVTKTDQCILDPDGQYIVWMGMLFQTAITIVRVYTPNTEQQQLWEMVGPLLDDTDQNLLMLGNF